MTTAQPDRPSLMTWPNVYIALGVLLVLVGIFLPQSWFNPLPQREILPPPPISGLWLLQGALVLQGVALIYIGWRRWQFRQIDPEYRLILPAVTDSEPGSSRLYAWLLMGVTLLALILRLISVNSDLWLDEITPILDYRTASAWQVWISYISSNNHLLNTLLVKLCTAFFGEQSWAIRLPAVMFGVATIPILYWFARQALSRRASLSAALLLAVSYHHIFYSQDARAYTAYVFFSLLSSLLLVKGLQEDRAEVWAFYILATILNFASILISSFVFAAQVVVGLLALVVIKRRGVSPLPMFKRLMIVFVITGFLAFQLYAAVVPQMYVFMRSIYADPSAGFAAL